MEKAAPQTPVRRTPSPRAEHSGFGPITITLPRAPRRAHRWDDVAGPLQADERALPEDDDDDSLVFTSQAYDQGEPMTWPILYLPYHITTRSSNPQHVDEILRFVHYKGIAAMALRNLLADAIEAADKEEDKVEMEVMAYLFWPFNVTSDGYWKEVSGMTQEEMDAWKEARRMKENEAGEREGEGDEADG
jgi:hypothetical protein